MSRSPESMRQRLWLPATIALLALAADLTVDVVLTAHVMRGDRLLAAVEGDPSVFTATEVAAAQGPLLPLIVAGAATFVGSLLLVGWFLRRCWLVVRESGITDLRYGPRWAVLGWLVPFLGLFVPKHIVDDIWRATADDPTPRHWADRDRSRLVGAWWTALVLSFVLARSRSTTDFFLITALAVEITAGLLGAAVVVGLLRRADSHARRTGVVVDGPPVPSAAGSGARPGVAALAAVAAIVFGTATAMGVQQGGQLPRELQSREAAVLATGAGLAEPGVSLPPRPAPLDVPAEPAPAVPAVDPTGPFESTLLVPPGGLERVTQNPDYAGTYDMQRVLGTVPAAERAQVKDVLTSYGFVRAQQAAFASSTSLLEVTITEFQTPAAAAEWVSLSAEGEQRFDVDTPSGVGYRAGVDADTVVDAVGVAVGRLAYELALTRPSRQNENEAVMLLRLQHAAAQGRPA